MTFLTIYIITIRRKYFCILFCVYVIFPHYKLSLFFAVIFPVRLYMNFGISMSRDETAVIFFIVLCRFSKNFLNNFLYRCCIFFRTLKTFYCCVAVIFRTLKTFCRCVAFFFSGQFIVALLSTLRTENNLLQLFRCCEFSGL